MGHASLRLIQRSGIGILNSIPWCIRGNTHKLAPGKGKRLCKWRAKCHRLDRVREEVQKSWMAYCSSK
ncbi:conserved hypothetical protein [Ricinus communis]|uniref:Uncharacterized protein n=1 Tax=Ricinus communis TaxID=3988 RepID=B9SD85_RICCO|nr:conserved hypothetical protein [Ricinus communis]